MALFLAPLQYRLMNDGLSDGALTVGKAMRSPALLLTDRHRLTQERLKDMKRYQDVQRQTIRDFELNL